MISSPGTILLLKEAGFIDSIQIAIPFVLIFLFQILNLCFGPSVRLFSFLSIHELIYYLLNFSFVCSFVRSFYRLPFQVQSVILQDEQKDDGGPKRQFHTMSYTVRS